MRDNIGCVKFVYHLEYMVMSVIAVLKGELTLFVIKTTLKNRTELWYQKKALRTALCHLF